MHKLSDIPLCNVERFLRDSINISHFFHFNKELKQRSSIIEERQSQNIGI